MGRVEKGSGTGGVDAVKKIDWNRWPTTGEVSIFGLIWMVVLLIEIEFGGNYLDMSLSLTPKKMKSSP